MMTCRQYIFQLTSGQLEQATYVERLNAWQHRLMCSRCRAFTKNDARLDDLLKAYRERLMTPMPEDRSE